MKKGDLEKWTDIPNCTNLLLFSQLVNELLFDYSIPSNRVATLNSHYLCLDAQNAIDGIENHGVPEGNLKPIMEELYSVLEKDPVFGDATNSPLDYFVKYQGDKYVLSGRVRDLSYSDLKKTEAALETCFFRDNTYFETLKKSVVEIITENDLNRQKDLFRLVKSLLTELMNMGYTLRYIYDVMDQNYWNSADEIQSPTAINRFFEAFDLNQAEYEVVFKVNRKRMEKFIGFIDDLNFVTELTPQFNNHTERKFLNKKNHECFLCVRKKALDPFSAAEIVVEQLSANAALYRLYDHDYRYNIRVVPCLVYGRNSFYKVGQPVRPVEHTRSLSSKQISNSMSMANRALQSAVKNYAINDLTAILNAAWFHSHSLDSESEENQLLDLWSIFESVLDINNKHTSDRIQQVCMYLIPILKRQYIFSLFEQLAADIKNYNVDFYEELVGKNVPNESATRIVCAFTLLPEYKNKRAEFLNNCSDFPLLKERIEYYAVALTNTADVFRFVEKHGERVKWQVMRIYRNRNLIIHNGESMPYLRLLIENLHSYVDDFLLYAIRSLSDGHNIESMCQELFVKECRWNSCFQKNKRPLDSDLISQMLLM